MTEPDELTEPSVTDVPEPDQPTEDEQAEEEAEAEQAESPEPVEEQEAHGPTQEEWEKRFQTAEARFRTYTAAVTKIWEEDAIHLMPLTLDAGAPTGFIDVRNKGRVEDETKAAVLAFLGFDSEQGMEPDPYSELCSTCKGWGEVVTGSKVANNDTRQCRDCRGRGYIADDDAVIAKNGSGELAAVPEEGVRVPAATSVESPEVESLRRRGYTIIPPMKANG